MSSRLTAALRPISGIFFLLHASAVYASNDTDRSIAECVRYVVGGSRVQAHISGYYHLLKQTFNNRLVYGQKCSQHALFASTSPGGSTTWIIGKGVGDDVEQYAKSRDSKAYPGQVTSWFVWSRQNESWLADPDLFVKCEDNSAQKSCRSFVIDSRCVPSNYRGRYVIDGIHQKRVKYKHVLGRYQLYYDREQDCHRWVVSHVSGSIVMEVNSDVESPFEVSTKWRILVAGSLPSGFCKVELDCRDYEEDQDSVFTCGRRQTASQIVPYILGADITFPGKWPFMLSYTRADGIHKCGATLLNKRWVITTGHCIAQANSEQEDIRLGVYNLNDISNGTAEIVRIKSLHIHPQFSWILHPFKLNHDVGLIELADDVTYTDRIQPVCLAPYKEHFPYGDTLVTAADKHNNNNNNNNTYTDCYMVGWGKTNLTSAVGGRLQDMKVTKVMPLSECFDIYYNNLSPSMRNATDVCLFGRTGGRICKGDSGSPFVCQKNGQWHLLGLGGWSLAECIDVYFFYPSVYTDVSVYRDWIFATMYGSD